MMTPIYFLLLLALFFGSSQSSTILVDGVSEWKNPTVHIGDTVVFKHKNHYNLYIFQNKRAFELCNFTQATLLTKPNNTSYKWYPSRLGFFYFTFKDGSLKRCQASQKMAIKVSSTSMPPEISPTPILAPIIPPLPSNGEDGGGGGRGPVASSPAFPWPFRPHEGASSPSPLPSSASTPVAMTDKGGGFPFINSNPAVPLPTGEVDSATIRPLPTSAHQGQVAIQLVRFQIALHCLVLLMF